MRDYDESVEKLESVRRELVDLFIKHEIDPQEALSLLSGFLVQIYQDVVENNSRENFTDVMTQCYDAFTLIAAETDGGVH